MKLSMNLSNRSVCRTCWVIWDSALSVNDYESWSRAAKVFHAFRLTTDRYDTEEFFAWLYESANAMATLRGRDDRRGM